MVISFPLFNPGKHVPGTSPRPQKTTLACKDCKESSSAAPSVWILGNPSRYRPVWAHWFDLEIMVRNIVIKSHSSLNIKAAWLTTFRFTFFINLTCKLRVQWETLWFRDCMGLHQILWLSCSLLQNWLLTYAMLIRADPPSGLPHRRKVTSTTLRSVTKRWRPDRIKCCLGKSWHLAMVAWCGMVLFGAFAHGQVHRTGHVGWAK